MRPLSRRILLAGAMAAGGIGSAWSQTGGEEEKSSTGGQAIAGIAIEPGILTSAITSEGAVQYVSGKIFDGLVTYGPDLKPRPQLATSWTFSPDGLALTFKLRPNVTWHDGKPFTSEDVAFSVLNAWKKFHSRGRSTFANVIAAETPDPLTVVWKLSKPAPYLLAALSSIESQIIPKHLYDGTDLLTNPHNVAPIGTGPFRFVAWERGQHIVLERNPAYWDKPKPYLDRVIFRIIPDDASLTTGVEAGELHATNLVSPSEVARLGAIPRLRVDPPAESASTFYGLGFNLDRPFFQDVRVRRAFAHAIDQSFILRTVYYGLGEVETGPLPRSLQAFYDPNVPTYPFDLTKAASLLDEAGFKPDKNGVRLSVTYDPLPGGQSPFRIAEYIRDNLGKIGGRVQIRNQDFATFMRRVYTLRDMDLFSYGGSAGPDPVIGTQRVFWSKNFQPGVPFSNGTHYANPEVDAILEAAQVEIDAQRRWTLYSRFQKLVQADVPLIPLVEPRIIVVADRRFVDYHTDADGFGGNWAAARLRA